MNTKIKNWERCKIGFKPNGNSQKYCKKCDIPYSPNILKGLYQELEKRKRALPEEGQGRPDDGRGTSATALFGEDTPFRESTVRCYL